MTQFNARLAREHSLDLQSLEPPAVPSPPASFGGRSCKAEATPLTASIASTGDERRAAAALVASRYAWRGYVAGDGDGMRPPGATLIATASCRVLGTLTVRADGPTGLAADESYRDVIDVVRRRGRAACELTRLAIDAAADWRPTLGALVGLAYTVSRTFYEVTDVFVEVNPRHERFYRQIFGFAAAGARRICPRVGAPAVLLRLDLEQLEQRRIAPWALSRPAAARFAALNS